MNESSNNFNKFFKQLVFVMVFALVAPVTEAFAQDTVQPDFSKMEPAILKGACIVGQVDVHAFEKNADKLFEKNAELVNDLLGGTYGMKPYRDFVAAWEIAKDIRVATGLYGVTFSMDCCDFENEDFNMVFACAFSKRFTLKKMATIIYMACDKNIGLFDDEDCWVNENTYFDEDSDLLVKMAGDSDILLLGTRNAVKQAERQYRDGYTPGFAGHAQTRLDGETFFYVTSCDFIPFTEIIREKLGNTCFVIPKAKSVTISMTSRKLTCKGEMVEKSDASGAFYILKSIMYLGSKTNMLPEYVKNRLLNCLNVDFDYDRTVGVSVDYSTMFDVVFRNKEAVVKAIERLSDPWLKGKLEKTKVTTTLSNLIILKTAVRNFKMDVGDYPVRLEELLTTNGSEKWDGPYLDMKSLPKDGWDMDFVYTLTGDAFGFDIRSLGADKKSGGDGINKDFSCWGAMP